MQSKRLTLYTGQLCLDFANTIEWHASEHPKESLNSYEDLVTWARTVDLLAEQEEQKLLQQAMRQPNEAADTLRHAIVLREAIYQIFSATNADRNPNVADLTTLNLSLTSALNQLEVIQTEAGFEWEWEQSSQALDQMLWPVVQSAADLLTSDGLDRVKECEDDRGCGYLFFDTSRNHSRRWCTMRGCGNRAKVRRYRKRQDEEA